MRVAIPKWHFALVLLMPASLELIIRLVGYASEPLVDSLRWLHLRSLRSLR
jgi:hypothetical protein